LERFEREEKKWDEGKWEMGKKGGIIRVWSIYVANCNWIIID